MARRAARSEGAASAGAASDQAVGWTTLVLGIAITGFLFWWNLFGQSRYYPGFQGYYFSNIAFLLWIPLIAILVFLRRETADFGMTAGDLRHGLLCALILYLLFVPVLIIVAPQGAFQDYYLRQYRNSGAITWNGKFSYTGLVFHQATLCFYMFAWEWYFRGFLLFGLKRLMPVVWAALFQAAAFALLHYNKPTIEVISSFFGALLLAVVAIRFRSFLPCWLIHWAISATFDFAVLYNHFKR